MSQLSDHVSVVAKEQPCHHGEFPGDTDNPGIDLEPVLLHQMSSFTHSNMQEPLGFLENAIN